MSDKPDKIIVTVGDGIGNLVETLPAIKAVIRKHPSSKIVIVDTIPNNFAFTEYLFKNHSKIDSVHKGGYLGQADLIYNMPYANPIKLDSVKNGNSPVPEGVERYRHSEVAVNIMAVMGRDFQPDEALYEVSEFFPISEKKVPIYDVVAHNGRSRHNASIWDVKLVHNFHQKVEYLSNRGFSVAVVGSGDEYNGSGKDETGRPIQ